MTETQSPAQAVADLGLTITSEFVPFGVSRNAKPDPKTGKPWRSLNWVVTLCRNGKPIITTDYSAGEAHCPAYKRYKAGSYDQERAIKYEIETGREVTDIFHGVCNGNPGNQETPILPDPLDVIHSLVADSDALEYSTYEDWADSFGHDPDSRDGERIYRQCLEYALKLRAAIGESGLAQLRTAFQDY